MAPGSRAASRLRGAATPPSGLRLNLAGVTFIDPAGIKLLGDLIRLGAAISECTGFVDELLSRNPSGR